MKYLLIVLTMLMAMSCRDQFSADSRNDVPIGRYEQLNDTVSVQNTSVVIKYTTNKKVPKVYIKYYNEYHEAVIITNTDFKVRTIGDISITIVLMFLLGTLFGVVIMS